MSFQALSLGMDLFPRSTQDFLLPNQKPYLESSHDDQAKCKYPRSRVENVIPSRLTLLCDRYGWQAGEFYGVLFLVGCWLSGVVVVGYGLQRFIDDGSG